MLPRWVRRTSSPMRSIGAPESEQRHRQEILHLAVAQRLDAGIVGRALDAAVPAQVVVAPVPVLLAVGLVVLAVIGNQVVEGEAVVAGDEVDALLRLALLLPVDVGTGQDAGGESGDGPGVALQEAAHVVPELAVPLLPAVADEAPDLIQTGRRPTPRRSA